MNKKELESAITTETQRRNILTCYDEDKCISFFTPTEFAEKFRSGRVTWFVVQGKHHPRVFNAEKTKKLYENVFPS